MRIISSLVLSLLFASSSYATKVDYKYLGTIKQSSPAFLSIDSFPGQTDSLLIS